MIDLAGTWRLRCNARNIEVDYPVPGDVHSALIAAGIIPHPYKGKNELACRWVADEEWVAVHRFELAVVEEGEYTLDIDYLDTVATVLVNGVEVLKAENCFRRYRPDVTKALKVGTNTVEVRLHSNTKAASEKQAAQPFYIPYSTSNNPIPNGNMLRKPQCHFGWDWNLAVVPFGVCGDFGLSHARSVRIENINVEQIHLEDGSVEVDIHVVLTGVQEFGEVEYSYFFDGQHQSFKEPNLRGSQSDHARFVVQEPRLWWPSGQGVPHLYDLEVRCGEQVVRRRIGLRKPELATDRDGVGSRFAFKVNGREIFCKGANWIPADALPSNATPELTRKLLQAAKDAGMNMIRVWGG
ncbi:MAG: glycoside hydrolase family 2 protein, partial [Phyllobacteriaceae bacterium]|nr:glycoside hydrolase family 2 protein [Phyllobacteriaceae bacterium]